MDEPYISGQAHHPDQEYKKPRNVWMDKAGTKHPVLNTFGTMLAVPVEVFFRHDFGQRWFTFLNFLGGLFILCIFALFEWSIPFITSSVQYHRLLSLFMEESSIPSYRASARLMPWIGGAYITLGLHHFSRIWWRNRTHTARHSFDNGHSLFEPVAIHFVWLINYVTRPCVYILMLLHPGQYKVGYKSTPPLIYDVRAFADIIIDPLVLLGLAYLSHGAVRLWLILSAFATIIHVSRLATYRRRYRMGLRDAIVDARDAKEFHDRQNSAKSQAKPDPFFKKKKRSHRKMHQHPDLDQMIKDLDKEMQQK